MNTSTPYEDNSTSSTATTTTHLADEAAQKADSVIKSTQRAANTAFDGLAETVQDVKNKAVPLVNRLTGQAEELAHRSMDAVRHSSQRLRETASTAGDTTVSYIKDEPVKAVLIAAATGAALMALLSLMTRSRDRL